MPTGLNADTGEADPDCVVADFTVTAGFAKAGLVADAATAFVGRLCVAALPEFEPHAPAEFAMETATAASLQGHAAAAQIRLPQDPVSAESGSSRARPDSPARRCSAPAARCAAAPGS